MVSWGLLEEILVASPLLFLLKYWICLPFASRPLDLTSPSPWSPGTVLHPLFLPSYYSASSSLFSISLGFLSLSVSLQASFGFRPLHLSFLLPWTSWSISSHDWFRFVLQTSPSISPGGLHFPYSLNESPLVFLWQKYLLSCSLHSTGEKQTFKQIMSEGGKC